MLQPSASEVASSLSHVSLSSLSRTRFHGSRGSALPEASPPAWWAALHYFKGSAAQLLSCYFHLRSIPGLLTGVTVNPLGLWNYTKCQRGKDSVWLHVKIFSFVFFLNWWVTRAAGLLRQHSFICRDEVFPLDVSQEERREEWRMMWGMTDDAINEPSWLISLLFLPFRPTCTQWASYTETSTLTTAWSNW